MTSPRYAVYYAPADADALAQFGHAWLGRDENGREIASALAGAGVTDAAYRAAIRSPRRYGFHATLKPPFHLQDGCSETDLHDALAAFTADARPFVAPALGLRSISGFLALTLSAACPEMDILARDCVRDFDVFRRPPSDAELARRRARGLTERQERNLQQWGYPYVFEEFRFHMTLTGRLDAEERAVFQTVLSSLVGEFCRRPIAIDSICLFAQDDIDADFAPIARYPLRSMRGEAEHANERTNARPGELSRSATRPPL